MWYFFNTFRLLLPIYDMKMTQKAHGLIVSDEGDFLNLRLCLVLNIDKVNESFFQVPSMTTIISFESSQSSQNPAGNVVHTSNKIVGHHRKTLMY